MHFEDRRGAPVLALQHAIEQDTLAICAEIEEEIIRVLIRKFGWDPSWVKYRLDFLLTRSIHVRTEGKLHVCRDPNDDMVLECAVLAGANGIVTRDKDLLVLGSYQRIRLLTPAEYLALLT